MIPSPGPWKEYRTAEAGRTYVALLSMFPVRNPLHVPSFGRRTNRVREQLESTPGVVGAAFGADMLRLKMYTLSAWEDRETLQQFIHQSHHGEAMEVEKPHLRGHALFVYWDVEGRDLPLAWKDALRRGAVRERALRKA